ncbi:Type III effector HopM1 [Pseudomonas syringae pv. maculicola]|nr:Type III effector HopM1 [Pseudomonas savastanoi pv. phaseolicola]KPB61792.1 Type III effector HopM1 [Pseudomonas amygdali pv. mellea]KPB87859.1 Type III effector HopM1 [Pseudomonas syringae pv. maculicola]KPB36008.1 Type III effector HopM1 [Pseudomonas savastanoi pv. phaseolicola]KPB39740.1 Type III effector HopM1 [Pseudomonas savastanoi pv. phaseolicola]
MNPPLTPNQAGPHAAESSATGAARLNVAARHTQLLQAFKAEQATAPVSGAPMISSRAALLIGSLLQAEKLPFEVMAERLSPERYQLKQFHGSDLQQLLDKFTQPGQVPDKAEVGQLIKGFAQSVADQLEHFQLMHDATPTKTGPHANEDRATLAVSQTALGEYAGRASKAIGEGLSKGIVSLDDHIAALDVSLQSAEEGAKDALHSNRQALVDAKTTLVGLHADFVKSPEAKRLASVAAHTQLDTVVSDLVTARNSVGGWKGAGPIVAAAVPQFLSSMTHLGYVRLSTSDKLREEVPETSSDASMLKAAITGMVTGIAHETVNSVVKPVFQATFQKTGLNERLNMVPLKAIDTNSVIPDPFELKSEHGELIRKTPEEIAQDKAFVKGERAVLNQKKVQGSSTHPLGEMIGYSAFGGSHAVRQMLNDLHQINGQTLSARALASGFGGAVSVSSQTLLQLKSTYVDPAGRKIPVFTPDRAETELKKDLAKGMDLREASVRTTFYSKAISGYSELGADLGTAACDSPAGRRARYAQCGEYPAQYGSGRNGLDFLSVHALRQPVCHRRSQGVEGCGDGGRNADAGSYRNSLEQHPPSEQGIAATYLPAEHVERYSKGYGKRLSHGTRRVAAANPDGRGHGSSVGRRCAERRVVSTRCAYASKTA